MSTPTPPSSDLGASDRPSPDDEFDPDVPDYYSGPTPELDLALIDPDREVPGVIDMSDDEASDKPVPAPRGQRGSRTSRRSASSSSSDDAIGSREFLRSRSMIIRENTEAIITKYDKPALYASIDPAIIENELLKAINMDFGHDNLQLDRSERHAPLRRLSPVQIADILVHLHRVSTIAASGSAEGREYDLVAIYASEGPDAGTYVTSEEEIRHLARAYSYELTTIEFKEVIAAIRDSAPRLLRCTDRDLVAVDNGIFDYRAKELRPFDPSVVFLSKSHVRFNPDAENPVIFNPDDNTEWDVETWMHSLSDDEGVVELFWEILGAIVRPHVRWGKAVFLYSESGNNGKGTLCELMRNICGSHASLSINDMAHEFKLEGIVDKNAIITDENDVGTYIDKAANFKALVTNDTILINRKYKSAIKYQFFGLMVQCLNDQPRIKDKSESLYRRQIFIPMKKRFEGRERRYIKSDYLKRTEVLEYVLKRVLLMNHYELSEPQATKDALDEYKMTNDPLREFFDEYEYKFVWDAVPFAFLYDAYREWFKYNLPSGVPLGHRSFTRELTKITESSDIWVVEDDSRFRVQGRMSCPEPLIAELNLTNWMDPHYTGKDVDRKCTPVLKERYRGMVRRDNAIANALAAINQTRLDGDTPSDPSSTPEETS